MIMMMTTTTTTTMVMNRSHRQMDFLLTPAAVTILNCCEDVCVTIDQSVTVNEERVDQYLVIVITRRWAHFIDPYITQINGDTDVQKDSASLSPFFAIQLVGRIRYTYSQLQRNQKGSEVVSLSRDIALTSVMLKSSVGEEALHFNRCIYDTKDELVLAYLISLIKYGVSRSD